MDIEHLKEFATIAQLGSFSLAAEALNLSQSALSKHIQSLEKSLGCSLFDRSHRKVTLSACGQILLPHAERMQKIHETLIQDLSLHELSQKALLKISSIPVMATYDITGTLAKFQKKYPQISLSVAESESQNITTLLDSGACELAFLRKLARKSAKYDYLLFCQDHLVAVLPKTHPLSNRTSLRLEELREDNILLLDKVTMLYDFLYDLCRKCNFTPKVTYSSHRPENIIDMIGKGMGISLMMARHVSYFKHEAVIGIPVEPVIEAPVCLVKLKNHALTGPAKLFWTFIQAQHDATS